MANIYKNTGRRGAVVPGGAAKVQEADSKPVEETAPVEPEKAQESALVVEVAPTPVEPEKTQEAQAALVTEPVEKAEPEQEDYAAYFDIDAVDKEIKQEDKTKQNKKGTSLMLSPAVLKEIDRRRGKTSRSAYVDTVLKRAFKL